MIVYVTTLVRYRSHGWLYKIDYARKIILERRKIASDGVQAKHGGPHGLSWLGDLLVTGTYSDIRFYDPALEEQGRFTSPLLSGVHGLSVNEDRIWVSSCNNENVICFDRKGKVLEVFALRENKELAKYFGLPCTSAELDRGDLDYPDQPFHVNHVQEVGAQLLICLHKQGCIWDLRAGRPVATGVGGSIHDAQRTSGGYLVNDTQNERLRSYDEDGCLRAEASVNPYPVRCALAKLTRRVGLNHKKNCKVNWLRGLAPLDDGSILVGSSPATLLTLDLGQGRIADRMQLSDDVCEAVFGILPRMSGAN